MRDIYYDCVHVLFFMIEVETSTLHVLGLLRDCLANFQTQVEHDVAIIYFSFFLNY